MTLSRDAFSPREDSCIGTEGVMPYQEMHFPPERILVGVQREVYLIKRCIFPQRGGCRGTEGGIPYQEMHFPPERILVGVQREEYLIKRCISPKRGYL